MKEKLHVLDLDGTLVRGNSSFGFFWYLVRKGKMPWGLLWQAVWLFVAFRRGRISLREFHGKVFGRFLKGRGKEEIVREVEPFLDEWLKGRVRKIGEGDRVLLSSSPDFLVGAIAERLGIEKWKGTEYAVDEKGAFSHVATVVDGREKVEWVKGFARERVIYAYSDSDEDLPLLEWADIVYVVKPNKKLQKIAKEKGWEVL
ncbi:MAG: haloacid dehalogenase-like hydrolase [Chlamydiales bacterium]|nr:haloacid dehalogenase-like hydrolase [Chlamydiales bacterium]